MQRLILSLLFVGVTFSTNTTYPTGNRRSSYSSYEGSQSSYSSSGSRGPQYGSSGSRGSSYSSYGSRGPSSYSSYGSRGSSYSSYGSRGPSSYSSSGSRGPQYGSSGSRGPSSYSSYGSRGPSSYSSYGSRGSSYSSYGSRGPSSYSSYGSRGPSSYSSYGSRGPSSYGSSNRTDWISSRSQLSTEEQIVEQINSLELNETLAVNILDTVQSWTEDVFEDLEELADDGFFDDGMSQILSAYKTALGKYIITFGSTVVPVLEKEIDLLEFLQLNDGCNITTAISCADFSDSNFFNSRCMKRANCSFLFELDEDGVIDAYQSYLEASQNYTDNLMSIDQAAAEEILSAISSYSQYSSEILNTFSELVQDLLTDFNCSSSCNSTCFSTRALSRYNSPSDVLSCVDRRCSCKYELLSEASSSQYDYYSLLEFANFQQKPFSYFMKVKDQY